MLISCQIYHGNVLVVVSAKMKKKEVVNIAESHTQDQDLDEQVIFLFFILNDLVGLFPQYIDLSNFQKLLSN